MATNPYLAALLGTTPQGYQLIDYNAPYRPIVLNRGAQQQGGAGQPSPLANGAKLAAQLGVKYGIS